MHISYGRSSSDKNSDSTKVLYQFQKTIAPSITGGVPRHNGPHKARKQKKALIHTTSLPQSVLVHPDLDEPYQSSTDYEQVSAETHNKPDSQYFLLPIVIPTKGGFVSTTALVHTRATHNFINTKLVKLTN